jgi:serine protease
MIRRPFLLAALGLAALAPSAAAAEHVPGEVVVRYAPDAAVPGAAHAAAAVAPRTRVVRTRPGQTVAERAAELRGRPGVLSATPNLIARAAYIPNDPGRAGIPGGWQELQWNFAGPFGVNAPAAWDHTGEAGRLGGAGVVVAVLDTGVAYADHRSYARSPDLRGNRFVIGRDFVDGDGRPDDENGHGTHVASTIAETIDNGIGVTGLAFGARIMPVRVLDRWGEGDSVAISKGIRFAARRGAEIINLSFEFGAGVRPGQIPDILDALRYAHRKGVLVVGASGNSARMSVAYPARASAVLSVGATTEHGCLADAALAGDPNCRPAEPEGRSIVQMTYRSSRRSFGLPTNYTGTSMATPHVSATAALIIASGVIGAQPSPDALEARLKATARDLGAPGPDRTYGAGLVDAAAATVR